MSCVVARPELTTREVLVTTQGVKMFAEWAPRTELFQELAGLWRVFFWSTRRITITLSVQHRNIL